MGTPEKCRRAVVGRVLCRPRTISQTAGRSRAFCRLVRVRRSGVAIGTPVPTTAVISSARAARVALRGGGPQSSNSSLSSSVAGDLHRFHLRGRSSRRPARSSGETDKRLELHAAGRQRATRDHVRRSTRSPSRKAKARHRPCPSAKEQGPAMNQSHRRGSRRACATSTHRRTMAGDSHQTSAGVRQQEQRPARRRQGDPQQEGATAVPLEHPTEDDEHAASEECRGVRWTGWRSTRHGSPSVDRQPNSKQPSGRAAGCGQQADVQQRDCDGKARSERIAAGGNEVRHGSLPQTVRLSSSLIAGTAPAGRPASPAPGLDASGRRQQSDPQ